MVRDGHLLGEGHWISTPDYPCQSRSVTKSVTSTLIGIAIDRGLIDGVYARMIDYVPAEYIPDDPAKHEITIWHLLNMSSGFQWNEDEDVVDWLHTADPLAYALDRPLAAPPGTVFNYDTASSHLLSVILTEATGMGTLDSADEVLFGREIVVYGSVVDNLSNDPTSIPMKALSGATRARVAAVAIAAGYATITVHSGGRITAYASVIDSLSNDPTTIPALH